MVASDLSEWADYAVHRAALLASEHKALLSLLYVIDEETPDPELLEKVRQGAKVVMDELSKEAEASLRGRATSLALKHPFEYSVQVEQGKDYVNIIKRARDAEADLIVLGFHGRHFFRDVFLGTTTEKWTSRSRPTRRWRLHFLSYRTRSFLFCMPISIPLKNQRPKEVPRYQWQST